jgi:hypothetical protein
LARVRKTALLGFFSIQEMDARRDELFEMDGNEENSIE